ncbi:hypothetical protein G6F59_014980 [Rhizopus arrhizus]|nr:hypothetical protein G6F59_014980 [Rhizopus arrhizus]
MHQLAGGVQLVAVAEAPGQVLFVIDRQHRDLVHGTDSPTVARFDDSGEHAFRDSQSLGIQAITHQKPADSGQAELNGLPRRPIQGRGRCPMFRPSRPRALNAPTAAAATSRSGPGRGAAGTRWPSKNAGSRGSRGGPTTATDAATSARDGGGCR